jgi:uncharacterized membrane protein
MVPWAVALVMAPFASRAGGWTSAAAVPVYAVGALVCHQRPDRSFVAAGRPWPVCARCSGIYLGAALMAGFGLRSARLRHALAATPRGWRARFVAGAAPLALTWTVERAGIAPVSNDLRAASGLIVGVVVAAAVVSILPGRPDLRKT